MANAEIASKRQRLKREQEIGLNPEIKIKKVIKTTKMATMAVTKTMAVEMDNNKLRVRFIEYILRIEKNNILTDIISRKDFLLSDVFDYNLYFTYDNINRAVSFDDICLYFNKEDNKLSLIFIYPGTTLAGKLSFDKDRVEVCSVTIDQMKDFMLGASLNFSEIELNEYVRIIKISKTLVHFNLVDSIFLMERIEILR